jgi:hypothetical protein
VKDPGIEVGVAVDIVVLVVVVVVAAGVFVDVVAVGADENKAAPKAFHMSNSGCA